MYSVSQININITDSNRRWRRFFKWQLLLVDCKSTCRSDARNIQYHYNSRGNDSKSIVDLPMYCVSCNKVHVFFLLPSLPCLLSHSNRLQSTVRGAEWEVRVPFWSHVSEKVITGNHTQQQTSHTDSPSMSQIFQVPSLDTVAILKKNTSYSGALLLATSKENKKSE